jgi:hypothetical protein
MTVWNCSARNCQWGVLKTFPSILLAELRNGTKSLGCPVFRAKFEIRTSQIRNKNAGHVTFDFCNLNILIL